MGIAKPGGRGVDLEATAERVRAVLVRGGLTTAQACGRFGLSEGQWERLRRHMGLVPNFEEREDGRAVVWKLE